MAKKRIARVNEQIRRELTSLLQRDVRDPRIGIVTVTAVETSPDLYHAKVFYSVMGSDEDRENAAEGLRAAAGYLRTEIGRRMHIRRAPELHFTYDHTLEHAMHIERLLQEARASSGTGAGESLSEADAHTDTDTDVPADAHAQLDTELSADDHAVDLTADESDDRALEDGAPPIDDGEHGRS